jgi:hypothetical protein
MLTFDSILLEYFADRPDGGIYFDVKNFDDLNQFESFLIKNDYLKHFDRVKLNELFTEQEQPTEDIVSYVTNRYTKFFKEPPSAKDLEMLVNHMREFYKTDKSFSSALQYMKSNPDLIVFEKNQIGQGEFALYLLLKDSKKIVRDSGDIEIGNKKFEIKKIKKAKSPIRFGTNMDLDSINSLRYVTFGFKKLFSSKEYRDGEKIKELSDVYDKVMDDAEASIGSKKLQLFYSFIKQLKEYTFNERSKKNVSSASSSGKNFVFKANDVDKDVYFKLSIDDLKSVLSKGKHQVTIIRTEDKQDTEELISFSEDVDSLLSTFLTKYPTIESFKVGMVEQLYAKYKQSNIHIMIIDEKNDFLIDPVNFKFNSVNQYVRPQVTLK